ncbi:MAG: hypothetical protein Q9187_003439 [Circinaria calcarea]
MHSLGPLLSTALILAPLINALAVSPFHNRDNNRRPNHPRQAEVPKAIYFITNDRTSNSVIALPISQDGTLRAGTSTPTGGAGSNPLESQGAVHVAGNLLFTLNAGTSTLSLFTISPDSPLDLTPLGPSIPTGGDFPVTLAVSLTLSVVCVGNTGAVAGVACATFSAEKGLGQMDSLRRFDLGQSTPPAGLPNTVSDILFDEGETKLLVTVKGTPEVANPGFLSVFPVVNGVVSTTETRSSPPGTGFLFGSVNIPGTNSILATDPTFGAVALNIRPNNTATSGAFARIAGQAATCWATVSPSTNTAFVTDAVVNRLVELDLVDLSVITVLNLTNGNQGMLDLQAAGNFIYALNPGNANASSAVAVFDVSEGRGNVKQIQSFAIAEFGHVQGMAVLG